MKSWITLSVTSGLLALQALATAPAGWFDKAFANQTDGAASFSIDNGKLNITITAAGADMWGKKDEGRFVFTPLAGDCEIIATTYPMEMSELYNIWARWGLMMRGSMLENAANLAYTRNKGDVGTKNRLQLVHRPSDDANSGYWTGGYDNIYTNLQSAARMRMVRQGSVFNAWISTNAPAYNSWYRVAAHTNASMFEALNVGVVVSRHTVQEGGSSVLTRDFADVVARNLVTANANGNNIDVSWIGDPAFSDGTLTGFVVTRAQAPAWSGSDKSEVADNITYWQDNSVTPGVSYIYKIYALVNNGSVTNRILVGASRKIRVPTVTGNPTPATLKGVYAEYYKPTSPRTLAAARVEKDIYDSWNNMGSDVYPLNNPNGLGTLDDFHSLYAGNITVPQSGCYGFVQTCDDQFHLTLDGVVLSKQTAWLNAVEIHTVPMWLEAGRSYPFTVTHIEGEGGEIARLKWFKGSETPSVIPTSAFEPFPLPWQHRDIGDSPRFGNAIYNSSTKSFTVASGGLGIDPSTGRDDAHFVWQSSNQDFDLIARLTTLNGPASRLAGAGITIRTDAKADNAGSLVLCVLTSGSQGQNREVATAYRAETGGIPVTDSESLPALPIELRLARRGAELTAYYRNAGSGGWVTMTNVITSWSGTLHAGMVTFSADTTQTCTGVFDNVTFALPNIDSMSSQIANNNITVSASRPNIMERQATAALPYVGWYWADALNSNVAGYKVWRSNRPDQDFTVVGMAHAPTFTYSEPAPDANTLVFYRFETIYDYGDLAEGGSNSLLVASKVYGVSNGSVTGSGSGLYTAFHRDTADNSCPVNLPVHTMIRNLGTWEKDSGNTIISASAAMDGVAIGPDNFQVTWAGKLTPPYSGYYWFRSQTDDAISVWVANKRTNYYWGYTAAAITSDPIWLEAGVPVPIHVYFQQGTGGGYFRMWWKHGNGYDGQFVSIPDSAMTPFGYPTTPQRLTHNETFGPWRAFDINTGKPGHTVVTGTHDAFDVTIMGGGADIWGSADGLHFFYREVTENFEMEGNFISQLYSDPWAKLGLMVRDGLNPGARTYNLVITPTYGLRIQDRTSVDGEATSATVINDIPGADSSSFITPVHFKMAKSHGKIIFWVNGVQLHYSLKELDVTGWSKLYVGLALTAHANSRLGTSMVTDVKFQINYPVGSMVILK